MRAHQIYRKDNKVIVVSHYAGKTVKGYAKCGPDDVFNIDTGVKLAKLRCDAKVYEKRVKRAIKLYTEAIEALDKAASRVRQMTDYKMDAMMELFNTKKELLELEESLKQLIKSTSYYIIYVQIINYINPTR